MTSERWHVTTSGPIEVRRDAFDETGRAYLIAVPSAGQRGTADDWTERVEFVARLIAAAPELVAALEDCVDSDDCSWDHNGHCQAHGDFDKPHECYNAAARALLARIKGEAE